MLDISFAGAAFAGILSFFTPCVLPMVPFYLCYMAGLSMSELRSDSGIAPGAQRRLIASSIFFALGVTTIFVLLGMGATAVGRLFADWQEPLSYVAAAILAVFGLHFLGIVKVPFLYREARLDSGAEPKGVWGAYVMGLAFGFGWTPCVGPALASILMVASGMGDVVQGGLLLLVYGLGMTAPFVIAALFSGPFLRWTARNRKYLAYAEKVMGGMLLLFAVLIATGSVNLIADAMIRWFPSFGNLG
ncbi:cytochrome c biogenesis CcdA family protein [Pseudoprimorskyibacter insulae]|uniref:Thiol:disulfide interchange protein DsbD n=1 Tax=Pseudoprimorskyibacter insulae TaxID=1695997 RepID=A0A2R8B1B8_9RHOB|nr:cytochrome c biogenesis protein CcdA [Pseudoprimorskyibacter insulae]SPF82046.1 Thiol:disulfide interchange protein DsbD [Pseudoprimorskyibacter insulae]